MTHEELIAETHDSVLRIEVALFGMPGTDDKGICGKVNDIKLLTSELDTRLTVMETNYQNLNISPSGNRQTLKNAASGGITGAIMAIMIGVIEYFRNR